MSEVPDVLRRMVDLVLTYRPKARTKAARKRKRLRAKKEKGKRH